jgi:hypothetical protein
MRVGLQDIEVGLAPTAHTAVRLREIEDEDVKIGRVKDDMGIEGDNRHLLHVRPAIDVPPTLDIVSDATCDSVLSRLKWYGGLTSARVDGLLFHFEKKIKAIIYKISIDCVDKVMLLKIAEECYAQASTRSGALHVNIYLASIEKAASKRPCDTDFGSEDNRESKDGRENGSHMNNLLTGYRQRSEKRQCERACEAWPRYWRILSTKVPSGPTLFCPTVAMCTALPEVFDIPPYLFRTFDQLSSGWSDTTAMTSVASIRNPPLGRIDLLKMSNRAALDMLHRHIDRPCFVEGLGSDNLISWTSSLLVAIQYAIYRAHMREIPFSEVKICAIHTGAFPKGQFARDVHLLKILEATEQFDMNPVVERFFRQKIGAAKYYNGEYFSQGHLEHVGRSSVTTLQDLLTAGLFRLYPDFKDPKARDKWAIRARDLRQMWWQAASTSDEEIESAFQIARTCFGRFDTTEITSILLTFRYRKPAWAATKGQFQAFVASFAMFADNALICSVQSSSQVGRTTGLG